MRLMLSSLTLLSVAVLAACGGTNDASTAEEQSAPETMTVSGGLQLLDGATNEIYGESGYEETDNCMGDGGYSDVTGGAQVTVYDADGTAVALGTLDDGVMTRDGYTVPCLFTFSVEDVPAEGNVFSVEVSHRGKINFEKDQAESLTLTLGE